MVVRKEQYQDKTMCQAGKVVRTTWKVLWTRKGQKTEACLKSTAPTLED